MSQADFFMQTAVHVDPTRLDMAMQQFFSHARALCGFSEEIGDWPLSPSEVSRWAGKLYQYQNSSDTWFLAIDHNRREHELKVRFVPKPDTGETWDYNKSHASYVAEIADSGYPHSRWNVCLSQRGMTRKFMKELARPLKRILI